MTKGVRRPVAAVAECKQRLLDARSKLPDGVGQQDVINEVIKLAPELDSLANITRWRNAWMGKVSDPQFTDLVEQAQVILSNQHQRTSDRLRRQKLKKVQ